MLHRIEANRIHVEMCIILMEITPSRELGKIVLVLKVWIHLIRISFQLWHDYDTFGKPKRGSDY